jgi:phenylalanyl-tRNA synthetase alpha chain
MIVFDELNQLLTDGEKAIRGALDSDALEKARVEYLGRSGKLKDMMGRIKEVAKEEKKAFGQAMNDAKNRLAEIFDESASGVGASKPSGPLPDPTLPGKTQPRGRMHPLMQTIENVASIFERIGFSIVDGPEMEDGFHNFEALNIPPDHPARDDQDTFVLSSDKIMRSQTSTVQIRTMEKNDPPIRVIAPGRVYRPDTVDATHHYGFSQIEGLAVEEGITFADLKATLDLFAREMFGSDTKTRFRPSFFPFTEPSAEVDVTCIFCGGKGCRVCKQAGWIEVLGCGMVDPNVFTAVGYDPEKYTGYAFGMGVERIAMLTLGVDDIRRFTENDIRFLQQF